MHTPGPWMINSHTVGVSAVVQEEGCLLVAVTYNCGESSQYNTHLIAAAPDLLAACEALCGGEGLASYRHQQGMAAIAKARGEQEPEEK